MGRRHEAATALVARTGVEATALPWESTPRAGLVINCTSVGMRGDALPESVTASASAYFEMVYASGATPTEEALRARGVPVVGGLSLLAKQAEASFELWFGVTPPPGVMYGSVDKHLKRSVGSVEG
jgi:shikimate dehydrogenase